MKLDELKKELEEYQQEIIDNNFPEYDKEVFDLIKMYDDILIAEKVYAGKHRIGFCTNEEYNEKEDIIKWRKEEFRRIVNRNYYK